MKVFNKIICFILIFALLTPVIVSAAEPVVAPADSGVSSTYDKNYIYITYQNKMYSCNRNQKINTYNGRIGCEVFYDSDNNEAGKYFYLLKDTTYEIQSYELSGQHTSYNRLPVSLEKTHWNNNINVSYWYSPGLNRCYVFSGGYVYGKGIKGAGIISYSASSSNGNSYLKMDNGGYYSSWVDNYYGVVVCSIFDFNDGSFKSSMVDLSASSVRTPSVFYFVDENKIVNASTVTTISALSAKNFDYIDNTYLSADVEYIENLPDDLICVYSNHLISGFWEPDGSSNIVTPSYYFSYQYIFKADKYILFVDSADKLKSITKSDSNALFTFATTCNKRIYYSLDGKTWTSLVDVQDMYSLTNTISSSYCFKDDKSILQLLFTSDDDYGKPLYEWKSLPDALDKVSTFDVWYDPTTGYEEKDLESVFQSFKDERWDELGHDLLRLFSPNFVDAMNDLIIKSDIDYAAKLDDYVNSSISKSFYYSFLMPGTVKFLQFDESTLTLKQVTQSSVYSMIQAILESSVNNTEYLKATREELFEYFTNLNNNLAYIDSSITSNFKDLKKVISPMVSDIASVKTLLEHNNVNVLDIHKLLADTLPSLAYDDSSVIAAIKDISLSGSGGSTFNFDDSAILARLDSIRDRMNYTYKPVLKDYDDDPDDDNTSVVDFVSTGLSDLVGGTVIQPIALAPGVLSAVTFVNTWIGNIWDNLGKLRPVVVLGLTFTVVNVVIRREEATA